MSIAKIETDRLLERMDEKLYRQVKKNLQDELQTTRNDLDQCRIHIQEMVDQKRWINWVGKFQEMYGDVDHLSPQDRSRDLLWLSGPKIFLFRGGCSKQWHFRDDRQEVF